jgi:hypothetical protein
VDRAETTWIPSVEIRSKTLLFAGGIGMARLPYGRRISRLFGPVREIHLLQWVLTVQDWGKKMRR